MVLTEAILRDLVARNRKSRNMAQGLPLSEEERKMVLLLHNERKVPVILRLRLAEERTQYSELFKVARFVVGVANEE